MARDLETSSLKVVGYFFPPVGGFFTHRWYFFTLVVIDVTNLWLSKLPHTRGYFFTLVCVCVFHLFSGSTYFSQPNLHSSPSTHRHKHTHTCWYWYTHVRNTLTTHVCWYWYIHKTSQAFQGRWEDRGLELRVRRYKMQFNPPESSGKQAISKEEFLVKIGKLINLSILREKAPDWLNGIWEKEILQILRAAIQWNGSVCVYMTMCLFVLGLW